MRAWKIHLYLAVTTRFNVHEWGMFVCKFDADKRHYAVSVNVVDSTEIFMKMSFRFSEPFCLSVVALSSGKSSRVENRALAFSRRRSEE